MTLARQMTLATIGEKNARLMPDKVALVCGDTRVTHSELNRQANRMARVFSHMGIAKGDRVAILSRNCHRFIEVLFALSKLGAVLVPLNWRLKADELSYIARDSDSRLLLWGEGFEQAAQEMAGQCAGDMQTLDMASVYKEASQEGVDDRDLSLEVYQDDIAVQMYTAAVEGQPRGAQITHGGYIAVATSVALAFSLTDADANLVVVPLFHTFGLDQTVAVLFRGGKCVLVAEFDAAAASEIIERERVTWLSSAGPQLPELVQELEKTPRDVGGLRIMMGDVGSKENMEAIRARAPGVRFFNAIYGQTECGMMATVCDAEQAAGRGARCAGRAVAFSEVRIFTEDDIEVPPGQVGEIVVRGPRVMAGYYKLPEVNAEVLRGGWLRTGDLATLDEDGYLYYVDRKRELIKSGMENVYPQEVERVLATHPAVREVSVIGIPDEQWGEAVTAIVALKQDGAATADDLIEFCKERIASYKKPKYVRFVDELPKDGTGQVLRDIVKAEHGYGLAPPA